MPFTFSHPAIIIPALLLPKKWTSVTGLVVGSMVPDFEYFFRMRVYSVFSHTLSGIFYFDLPVAIILTFVYHLIVRDNFISHLPSFLKKRFIKFTYLNWPIHFRNNLGVSLLSMLIGICSHLFWDNFTHKNGFFIHLITVLASNVSYNQFTVPVYKIIQHASSLTGGLLIFYCLYKIPVDQKVKPNNQFLRYWGAVTLITALVIIMRLRLDPDSILVGHIVVTGISSCIIGLVVVSWWFKYTAPNKVFS